MATTYISRTGSMAGGSRTTWTLSMWVKFYADQTYRSFFSQSDSTDDYTEIKMHTGDYIHWENAEGVMNGDLKTTQLFRDPSAWYNIIFVWDTTNDTSGDRMRIYVNGDRITSFSSETQPPEDTAGIVNKAGIGPMIIGATDYTGSGPQKYWNGDMSHIQFVDGAALAPTEFGEVDSTSGIWKIKTGAYATPGTNGFFLKMEDRTNLDLDSSSNAHTFATTGTLTPTYDNPSNNFATMNPLVGSPIQATYTTGNLTAQVGGTNYPPALATMGLAAGLWYFEMKCTQSADNTQNLLGIQSSTGHNNTGTGFGTYLYDYGYYGFTGYIRYNATVTAYGDTWTADDIIGCYMDLTANKLYFAKNGTIQNSGTGWSIQPVADTPTETYRPAIAFYGSNTPIIGAFNFGNGYFGTTAITSPENDEGGIGAFKYDPSDGGASSFDGAAKDFRAICTKNIKLYGG